MHRQVLKDAHFRTVGYIDTANYGKQTARDAQFHAVGHYDPRTNSTRDAQFRVVGHGNLLAALITCR